MGTHSLDAITRTTKGQTMNHADTQNKLFKAMTRNSRALQKIKLLRESQTHLSHPAIDERLEAIQRILEGKS